MGGICKIEGDLKKIKGRESGVGSSRGGVLRKRKKMADRKVSGCSTEKG